MTGTGNEMYTFYAVTGLTDSHEDTCIYALFEDEENAQEYVDRIKAKFLSRQPVSLYCQKHADSLSIVEIHKGFEFFEY